MRASDNSVVKIFGPGSLSTPTASTTVSGISELATNSETTTGTATDRVVTPAGLNAVTVAERSTSNSTYLALAGGTLTGVLAATAGSNSAPSIHFGDSDSGIFGGTNTVSLTAGGTTRLTADTGVSVTGTLAVTGAITSTSDLTIAEKVIHAGDTDTFVSFPSANTVSVETGGNEALRVDSEGRLLVGVTSAQSISGTSVSMQNCGTAFADSSSLIGIFSADNVGSTLAFAKSRNATLGQQSALLDNDEIGKIRFYGSDGNDFANYAAEILAEIDGTPANNNMPGSLVFKTTASGATPTERLRIAANGTTTIAGNLDCSSDLTIDTNTLHVDSSNNRVGIGTTSPSAKLHVQTGATGTIAQFRGDSTDLLNIDGDSNQITLDARNVGALAFEIQGSSAMSIDSNGRVGIGETNPSFPLDVIGTNNTTFDHVSTLSLTGTNAFDSGDAGAGISFSGKFDSAGNVTTFAQISGIKGNTATGEFDGALTFGVRNDTEGVNIERMRITNAGRIGIGTTSPDSALHVYKQTNDRTARFQRISSQHIDITQTSGINSFTSTGKNFEIGTTDSNDLIFDTNDQPRMTIDSSGRLLVGTSTQFGDGLDRLMIENSTNGGRIAFGSSATFAEPIIGQVCAYWADNKKVAAINFFGGSDTTNKDDGTIRFATSSANNLTERMRIDSSGNVYFGGITSNPNGTSVGGSAFVPESGSSDVLYMATTASSKTLVRFHTSSGQCGIISVNGTSTSYVENSDYRLKENETAISDGISRLKTLKPYRFNFKSEPDKTVDGFFAHEVSPFVPQAIVGEKDAVNEDGSIDPQGIDHSKLVPLLVAALQEAIGRIEALEAN